MKKSVVYWTDFRTNRGESLVQKCDRLYDAAGLGNFDFHDKFVAIKLHFGELGNLAFLRHNYAAGLVSYIKARGGRPFLTDCNTLYTGSRTNALDHLGTAILNGYSYQNTGAHVIIADGLKGDDDIDVPVQRACFSPVAKIGRALADADIVISLTHFKGHESTGFGGALKNLGMGGGSRRGKKDMHSSCKPRIGEGKCVLCRRCEEACAHGAPDLSSGECSIDYALCVGCGRCVEVCPTGRIVAGTDEKFKVLNSKIAEYAKAVVAGKPNFHISFAMDISPLCDCYSTNDAPIVPDVGIFASEDPVAIDMACVDAVNRMPANPNSSLGAEASAGSAGSGGSAGGDHFTDLHPATDWRSQVEHGEEIGLGSMEYELVKVV